MEINEVVTTTEITTNSEAFSVASTPYIEGLKSLNLVFSFFYFMFI